MPRERALTSTRPKPGAGVLPGPLRSASTAVALSFAAILVVAESGRARAQTAVVEPARAKAIVARLCVACHGQDGDSAQPEVPRLAGLQPEYLAKQLAEFRSARRRSAVMGPLAAELSPEDIASLAAFYGSMKPIPGRPGNTERTERGRRIYADGNAESGVPSCSGCHYPDGSGTSRFPRIAGQQRQYVLQQLKDFRSERRDNDRGLMMQSVALRMTDAEMEAVAEYVAGMK